MNAHSARSALLVGIPRRSSTFPSLSLGEELDVTAVTALVYLAALGRRLDGAPFVVHVCAVAELARSQERPELWEEAVQVVLVDFPQPQLAQPRRIRHEATTFERDELDEPRRVGAFASVGADCSH